MRMLLIFLLPLIAGAVKAPVELKEGPGKDKVLMNCQTCHSLEYVEMNAHFLGEKGWAAEITKMISAYGAPIAKEDVPILLKYLSTNY
jgi:hypothetical protein